MIKRHFSIIFHYYILFSYLFSILPMLLRLPSIRFLSALVSPSTHLLSLSSSLVRSAVQSQNTSIKLIEKRLDGKTPEKLWWAMEKESMRERERGEEMKWNSKGIDSFQRFMDFVRNDKIIKVFMTREWLLFIGTMEESRGVQIYLYQ